MSIPWLTPAPQDLFLIRHIRGMRSCWSGEDDQLVGGVDVTVVVRWGPGSTLGCGTRMARPVRNGWGPGAKWEALRNPASSRPDRQAREVGSGPRRV
jgi:hypothetical protein